ncbi:MAG: hypothetical protein HDR50_06690 [Desulfovibrio sp.]|uniref:hypothetical protein n=1 Tax=Desulfovibrio sp. TaxID=885 RepID=UPI001A738053|nr:hypothetical protein [Desulfovibrio sp.]MBD5417335.1 hypothetical protein [Desulfovibrio sp.]
MLDRVWQWIKDIFGQAARDRLHLCEDRLKYCKEERDEYKIRCKSLEEELAKTSAKLQEYEDRDKYVNLEFCLLPKNYIVSPAPRCPNCTKVMTKFGVWYKCASCGYDAEANLVHKAMKEYFALKKC